MKIIDLEQGDDGAYKPKEGSRERLREKRERKKRRENAFKIPEIDKLLDGLEVGLGQIKRFSVIMKEFKEKE